MKLIDKDKLIKEIERRKNFWKFGSSIQAVYRKQELDELLDFINTLDEVKANKDLEKAARDYVEIGGGISKEDFTAGTEWQKQQEYKDSELKLMNEHDKAKKFIFELCRVYDITDSNGYAVDSKSLISEFESYMKGE